ncbi:MAG: matrixin family metalloprotease [Candidatus Kaiserbacteria bacterium]|nr:matrixin family metalloprotease [Candidatus Kaiserbacteria bacterium]
MRRMYDILILVVVLGIGVYLYSTHKNQAWAMLREARSSVAPCSTPLTYSIGTVDSHFGIKKDMLIKDLAEAEDVWETPAKKELFTYVATGGDVTVNLIYDNRQASTDALKNIGLEVDSSLANYNEIKQKYAALHAQVANEQKTYDSETSDYSDEEAAYNAEVEQWNQKGGAPGSAYAQLQQQKIALQAKYAHLKALQSKLNSDIDTLNAEATVLNQQIVQLNLNVDQYNQTGSSGGTFEEGVYEEKNYIQTINIYEYSNHIQLVRVLAHELGHALGLEHVDNSKSIMYKINTSTSLVASSQDIAELDRVCRLQ